jgi:hypothetical protein
MILLLLGLACRTPGTSAHPIANLAGTYQTRVTLTSSTCAGVGVQDNPTIIAHTSGTSTFTLSHAGQSYVGTLGTNGSFTTAPKPINVGSTVHTLRTAGTFTTAGFTADVTVVVTGSMSCGYAVRWAGTR